MMMLLDRRLREEEGGCGVSRGDADDGEFASEDPLAGEKRRGGERRRRRETGEVEGSPRAIA
jgi:hypothetical protein